MGAPVARNSGSSKAGGPNRRKGRPSPKNVADVLGSFPVWFENDF
jgi:hypothetical protein